VSVAWSALANAAYVVSDGAVFVLDPKQSKPRAIISAVAGTTRIRFASGGRLGFIVNPSKDSVYILDTAINQIVQTAIVEAEPFEVTFSESLAYIRHLQSETVLMIPLAAVGTAGAQVTVADFPGGQRGFGATGIAPLPADGIVGTPSGDAVLVTNPADQQIYFYREGMAAPMGSLSAYSHVPRATLVVDRTLRETKPGHYETTATMPKPGVYDVSLFVDSPRIISCFQVTVGNAATVTMRSSP
jgi:YVTN family beta-propeller protein